MSPTIDIMYSTLHTFARSCLNNNNITERNTVWIKQQTIAQIYWMCDSFWDIGENKYITSRGYFGMYFNVLKGKRLQYKLIVNALLVSGIRHSDKREVIRGQRRTGNKRKLVRWGGWEWLAHPTTLRWRTWKHQHLKQ